MKQFEKEVAKNAKTNPKTFHKYVNSKTKVRTGIGELQVDDVTSISDEEKASTTFRLYTQRRIRHAFQRVRIMQSGHHAREYSCQGMMYTGNYKH